MKLFIIKTIRIDRINHRGAIILFGVFLAALMVAYAEPAGAIYGGQESLITPVVVISFTDSNGRPLGVCSGTLVAQNIVLTARHCLLGWPVSSISVVVASPRYLDPPLIFRVENYWTVSGAFLAWEDDLGLIKFAGSVPLSWARAAPISPNGMIPGVPVAAVGWGRTQPLAEDAGSMQRKVSWVFPNLPYVFMCNGDSGGPVLDLITGSIVGVMVGVEPEVASCGGQGIMHFGLPARHYQEIINQIAYFGGPPFCTLSVTPASGPAGTVFTAQPTVYADSTQSCTLSRNGYPPVRRSGVAGCRFSEVFVSGDADLAYIYPGPGNHQVIATVQDSGGGYTCYASFSVIVPPGAPFVRFTPANPSVAPGSSITFTADISNPSSSVYYSWTYRTTTAAASESPDADRFASLSFGKGTVANQLATLLEGLLRFPGLASLFPQPATSLLAPAQK